MADEQDLFERIWYADQNGRIDIGFNLKRLNKPDSPVFSHSDNLLPWAAFACLTYGGWRLGGWIGAVATAASMVVLIATTVNWAVMSRLRKRALAHALSGQQGFDELWAMGALSVRLKNDPSSEVEGPGDDWRAFARRRLPKPVHEERA